MSARVYEQFEKLVCSDQEHSKTDCHCATLQRHYGGNIFKCTFPSCDLHRQGFPSRRARAAHIEHHARPWKCSEPECPFAIIGFARSRDRNEHWRKRHQVTWQQGRTDPSQGTITRDDVAVLLFELTKTGDVDGLQKAWCLLGGNFWPAEGALILAAKMGSLLMVETFSMLMKDAPGMSNCHRWPLGLFLDRAMTFQTAIVRSGNPDLFRWLLDEICGLEEVSEYGRLAGEAFSTHSPDMYAVWEEFLLDPTRRLAGACRYYSEGGEEIDPDGRFREAKKLLLQYNKRSVLFDSPAFGSAAKDAFCEARLFQTWQRLIDVLGGGPLNPRFLGWSLTRLAKVAKPSISIAKELLRLGAPINFPRGKAGAIATTTTTTTTTADAASRTHSGRVERKTRRQTRHRGMTALHHAAHGTSEAAARLTRFLLEEGADPEYGFAGIKPANERGAVLMEKWLGESWEAVVARTGEARRKRRERDGDDEYSESDDDEWREEGDESDRERGRAKRRKTRRAGKKRKVDSSEDGGDNDSQVGRESDPTAKRRRSQRVTEKRNMKESSDDEDTEMSNDGE